MPDGNASTVEKATDQAQQVASNAADRSKEVLCAATGQAQQVVGAAREQASLVATEASAQAVKLLDDVKAQLHDQVQGQTVQLGDALGRFAVQLRALSEGRPEEAGPLNDVARAGTERVEQLADRIQTGGFDAVFVDIQRFARRRPVVFLAGALAAGLAVGRFARGGRDSGAFSASGSADASAISNRPNPALPAPWDELPASQLGGSLDGVEQGQPLNSFADPFEANAVGLDADPYRGNPDFGVPR